VPEREILEAVLLGYAATKWIEMISRQGGSPKAIPVKI
jgi:hypothetical protein